MAGRSSRPAGAAPAAGTEFDLEGLLSSTSESSPTFEFDDWGDVQVWADKHGIEVDAAALSKGNGWGPGDMEAVAAAVERADDAFPGLADRISRITYGAILGEAAHVTINESPFRPVAEKIDLCLHAKDARVREAHARDPKQVASDLYEVVLHEMGHVREFSTPWLRHRAGAGLDVAKAMVPGLKRGIIRQAMIDAGYADKRGSVDAKLVAGEVSRYGLTSDAEMHAEVFCLMLRPGGIDDRSPEAQRRLRDFWASVGRQTAE